MAPIKNVNKGKKPKSKDQEIEDYFKSLDLNRPISYDPARTFDDEILTKQIMCKLNEMFYKIPDFRTRFHVFYLKKLPPWVKDQRIENGKKLLVEWNKGTCRAFVCYQNSDLGPHVFINGNNNAVSSMVGKKGFLCFIGHESIHLAMHFKKEREDQLHGRKFHDYVKVIKNSSIGKFFPIICGPSNCKECA